MDYMRVTKENLEKEHICCAISNNNDVQVASKKAWLKERFDDGLVFLKSVERGKCFIEYIPAEKAWNPIEANGYLFIDCLWVSGSLAGHGYAGDLLNACVEDGKAQGKAGLCILSAAKKKPFLADPKFLKHEGFSVADEADNGIQLWFLPFSNDAKPPKFCACARHPHIDEAGYVLYYTSTCRSWRRRRRRRAFRFMRSISRTKQKRRTRRRRSPTMRCSLTARTSQTNR